MVNILKKGAEFLATKRPDTHGITVTIRRTGYADTLNVPAAVARTQDLRQEETGFVLAEEVRDFKIAANDYKFGGVKFEPVAGDVILDSSTGTTIRYVVLPLVGESAARWADPHGISWRIHTKRKNA